uniref:Ovule protein n=1 Tax=Ditylenchus dipsaci TaxID=166011 RepID=A0A915DIA9_9BILA
MFFQKSIFLTNPTIMEGEVTSFRKVKSNKKTGIRKRVEKQSSSSNDSDVSDKGDLMEASSAVQRRQKLRRKNMIHTTNKKKD